VGRVALIRKRLVTIHSPKLHLENQATFVQTGHQSPLYLKNQLHFVQTAYQSPIVLKNQLHSSKLPINRHRT